MIWAILGSGPSMNQEVANYVRGKCKVVAISDTYNLAPWADFLVSHDRKWWRYHEEALQFKGRKLCRFYIKDTEKFSPLNLPGGSNSGLMGMYVAQDIGGASKILLLGFDFHGTHYFGKHPVTERNKVKLVNTTAARRKVHLKQFKSWKGCDVINCTPGSELKHFAMGDIREIL